MHESTSETIDTTTATPGNQDGDNGLYEHVKRNDWGVAILAWERDGRRAYQFEDGKLRVFKDGYYDLLKEVDRPADETRALMGELNKKLGRSQQRRKAEESGETMLSFEQQLGIFGELYPAGFEDPKWLNKIRGAEVARRLKRHRDPAIAEAREKLSAAALDELIAAESFETIHERLVALIEGTNLVTPKQLEPLRALEQDRRRGFAAALRELLWGEGAYTIRFERFMSAMRSLNSATRPGWQLCSVISALVHPDEHICIRPSSFREQARWMAPRLEHDRRPNAELYGRYLSMAMAVRERLNESGMPPRDMMDVHDFMWNTLRPSAKKSVEDDAETAAGDTTGDDTTVN